MDRWNYGTYNPIIEQKPIPKLRIFNPVRPPEPGTALVLVPREGNPITVRHGEQVPDPHYGAHQYSCLVDLAEHRLAFEVPLVSRDPGFVFRGHVVVGCRVGEPAVVVVRGIRDVGATLYDPIRQLLRPIARRYDIGQFHEAEEMLNRTLESFYGDSALRLRNSAVELLLDDDEIVQAAREYRDVNRETRLNAMRRERHLELMRRDGAEGLLAEIMEKEGARAALDWIAAAEANERAELRATLDRLLARGGVDREPFDHLDAERDVVDRIIGGSNVAFGGTRSPRRRDAALSAEPSSAYPPGDDVTAPPQDGYPVSPADPSGPYPDDPPDGVPYDDPPRGGPYDDDPPGRGPYRGGPRVSRVRGVRRPDHRE